MRHGNAQVTLRTDINNKSGAELCRTAEGIGKFCGGRI